MSALSNYIPKYRLISDMTVSTQAGVTTTENHGYQTGYVVRVLVPSSYGMSVYQQTQIVVTGDTTFTTDIDTSNQLPFVAPVFVVNGPGFTQAQVTPMTGVEVNDI